MELGVIMPPLPRRAAYIARMVEELGFAAMLFPDSQNLAPEVWSQLTLAANATTTLKLGPGVSNSLTRDPAVTACAALTLQVESDGRAVLGMGRGDSSVQRIGKREDRVAPFAAYLDAVQRYLRGEAVDRDGFASRLEWLPHVKAAKVPLFVAATGPRVIEVAARHADAVCLAAGADPAHLGALLERARSAARAAGRAPDSLRYGAFVNCVIHPDRAVARDALRGTVATFARFSAFRGSHLATLPEPLQRAAQYLREHYDMREHTRADAAHTAGIGDAFVDWFAIAGPSEVALPRFRQLADLGLDFCYVIPGSSNVAREVAGASLAGLAQDIVPALRSTEQVPPP
jgi:5,10-methylenetetrahydromethanopterin reductase